MKEVIGALEKATNVVIFPHIMMDGDCIGSGSALMGALSELGKTVYFCSEENLPYQYTFLIKEEFIIKIDAEGNITFPEGVFFDTYDCAVAVDSSDIDRLGVRADFFKKAKVTISIDHHKSNQKFAMINHIESKRAATAEIIYDLIKKLGCKIDLEIASAIYAGILSDTGGFRFSNTTPKTHRIAGELLKTGIDVSAMSKVIFDEMSFAKLKLIGRAIDSIELFLDGKLAIMTLDENDIRATGSLPEDFNEIVNFARNIRGVEVAALIRTTAKDKTKVSVRTNKHFDASEFAAIFSGGGHARAAGFNYSGDVNELKQQVIGIVRKGLGLI
jgi:phosphoesterase RecJ-like protein